MDMSIIIYGLMALLFLVACYNPLKGTGLLALRRASRQLKKAVGKLEDLDHARQIRNGILNGSYLEDSQADSLFPAGTLEDRMTLYCGDVKRMALSQDSKYQCDIEEYYHEGLLDQISNAALIDHVCSGLTGLGILGTFIGMAAGLTSFDSNSTDAALNSIDILLGGMKYAFTTSIVGIALSLLLGLLYRFSRNDAEKNLDEFIHRFRRNVLSNQQVAASNQLLDRLRVIERHLTTKPDDNLQMISLVADQIVDHIGEQLKTQTQDMQKAMEETTKQQQLYVQAIKELNQQIAGVGQNIEAVGNSFNHVLQQTDLLQNQIAMASHALQRGVDSIKEMIQMDTTVMENQIDVSNQLNDAAKELNKISNVVSQQARNTADIVVKMGQLVTSAVDETADGCNRLIQSHYADLKGRMENLTEIAADQHQKIRVEAAMQMTGMRQEAENIIRQMPQTVAVREELNRLSRQNQQIIETQGKIIKNIGQRNRLVERLMGLWRNGT